MAAVTIQTALRKAKEALALAEEEVKRRRLQVEGLEMAVEDWSSPSPSSSIEAIAASLPGVMARSDAVIQVLRIRLGVPMSPKTLVAEVGALRGTIESRNDISASLAYLKRMGRVKSPAHGEWILAGDPDPYGREPDDEPEAREPEPDDDLGGDVDPEDIPF